MKKGNFDRDQTAKRVEPVQFDPSTRTHPEQERHGEVQKVCHGPVDEGVEVWVVRGRHHLDGREAGSVLREDEPPEAAMVPLPDAHADAAAVVVEARHAEAADPAVVRAHGLWVCQVGPIQIPIATLTTTRCSYPLTLAIWHHLQYPSCPPPSRRRLRPDGRCGRSPSSLCCPCPSWSASSSR